MDLLKYDGATVCNDEKIALPLMLFILLQMLCDSFLLYYLFVSMHSVKGAFVGFPAPDVCEAVFAPQKGI